MFDLTDKQLDLIHDFKKNHDCKLHEDPNLPGQKAIGAIGGQYTYSFTPTGLWHITKIYCVCGEFKDVTDCEGW